MSTTQACGEPDWFMKRESERVFGDLNSVYTVTGLTSPTEHPITKVKVDGIALQKGETIQVTGSNGVSFSGGLMCGGHVVGWRSPEEYDITLSVDDRMISFKEMDARIRRLEEQVEMWKSAAMTLKEINDELRPHKAVEQDDPIAAYERAKKATK